MGINDIRNRHMKGRTSSIEKVLDNMKFQKMVSESPPKQDISVKTFHGENLSFNNYLAQRIWPRSIYVTDKLIRLGYAQRLEMLKRFIKKKRSVPFNLIWLLLLLFGIAAAVIVIFVLLPRFVGG